MEREISKAFESHFSVLKDPRINRKKLYPLVEILFVVLCASICGAESWRDYVLFGQEKVDFFRKYFPYKNGIPSKIHLQDCFMFSNRMDLKNALLSG